MGITTGARRPAAPATGRMLIEKVTPVVDGGARPAVATPGEAFDVAATVFREGHEAVGARVVLARRAGRRKPVLAVRLRETPEAEGPDRFRAEISVPAEGNWCFRVEAWTDPVLTWLSAAKAKAGAGTAEELDFLEGQSLLKRIAAEGGPTLSEPETRLLEQVLGVLADTDLTPLERLEPLDEPAAVRLVDEHPLCELLTLGRWLPLRVDRERALYGAWYEFFPRSEGAEPTPEGAMRSGTLRTAARRLPAVAAMGFDVVYLPPIHPIGVSGRKGPNNSTTARPGDPGSPWAIGAAAGGHDKIHPDLGTLKDFDHFVAVAHRNGLEVALDFALQCSPDHPWVAKHPQWFRHRLDGSVAYAENPPKRYEDIYPLDFDTDPDGILEESLKVLRHWMRHGVRIFRVDNPHTKPVSFWERLTAEIRASDPDVLFLAEAFTRPPMVHALAKAGFHQSYTYFTWRDTKQEITEYLEELSGRDGGEGSAYLRPNLFVNTPDILPAGLRLAPQAAFAIRAVLAAAAGPSWGVYCGFELFESTPTEPAAEEYADSEKYQYRPRDWAAAEASGRTLAPLITALNRIRRAHPSLRQLRNLRFHEVDDENVLCFSKRAVREDGREDWVIAVISLDPHRVRETLVRLDPELLGFEVDDGFEVEDALTGERHLWRRENYVRLDPKGAVAHLLTAVEG